MKIIRIICLSSIYLFIDLCIYEIFIFYGKSSFFFFIPILVWILVMLGNKIFRYNISEQWNITATIITFSALCIVANLNIVNRVYTRNRFTILTTLNGEVIEDILTEQDVHYIDITQMVHTFALRKDLILAFEIVLRQIQNKKQDIQFLISEDMEEELKKYLPFTFKTNNEFFDSKGEEETGGCESELSLDSIVPEIIKNLTFQLKGHEDFKKDFSFNLKKFALLNKMKQRKIFSVFLTGESGIGKTEFAKILSEIMYPSQALIKINFGNYSNEGVLNSLIGSPLGYIGSEEGGELINKMKLSKSKVILIDEFEKATPSVFHFFYELLEDGKFTDRHGTEHNLNGYIIVFTSNMSKERYLKLVPDPLKSRFDMVYRFVELSSEEKIRFINESAKALVTKIYENTSIEVQIDNISCKLNLLIKYNNLRSIKRKVEDIVIEEYYKEIDKK